MRLASFAALALICACALTGSLTAQCTAGGGSVDLGINGNIGIGQVVTVQMPSTLDITLTDNNGPGNPFILLAGSGISCMAIPLAWGGSVDLAGISIVADGISPVTVFDFMAVTDFQVSVPANCSQAGTNGPALQAIHQDPTAAPIFFNHTGAAGILYSNAALITTVYDALGDDSSVQHLLGMDPCAGYNGQSITFGGATYSDLYIGSNGQVTFNGGSNDFSPTTAEFFSGWNSGLPGVAVFWIDLARSSAVSDSVVITEDLVAGTVSVDYKNQEFWSSQTPAGDFSCTFGALGIDTLTIDLTATLPGAVSDADPIVGVTDGAVGGLDTAHDYDVAIAAGGGAYSTPAGSAPESICEQYLQSGADPAAPLDNVVFTFMDVTSTFDWLVL